MKLFAVIGALQDYITLKSLKVCVTFSILPQITFQLGISDVSGQSRFLKSTTR